MKKMNKREATRLAKEKYGPTASAVTQSNVLDRHQRFGVAMVSPGGVRGDSTLVVLGYGDSYISAFEMAKNNPVAIEAEKQWQQALREWEVFKDDPRKAVEIMKQSLKEAINNGE
jgi:hypothetical protein